MEYHIFGIIYLYLLSSFLFVLMLFVVINCYSCFPFSFFFFGGGGSGEEEVGLRRCFTLSINILKVHLHDENIK